MELTIEQLLQQGVAAHKEGKLQDAERLYRAILKACPKHPDAHHNMGVLAVGVGKVQEALPFFKTALEGNPNANQFWLSYIDVLVRLERLADAKAVFQRAKERGANGDRFDQLEQQLSLLSEVSAEQVADKTKAQKRQLNSVDAPKLDQALKLAKKTSFDGSSEDPNKFYSRILPYFPNKKIAIKGTKTLSGRLLGTVAEAQDPTHNELEVLSNFYNKGQFQQALAGTSQLLKQFPTSAILLNLRGAIHRGLAQLDIAIDNYRRALAIKPDFAEAHNNLGNALNDKQDHASAINSFEKAVLYKPDYAVAYNNLGMTFTVCNSWDKGIINFNKAIKIFPSYARAHFNLGNSLFTKNSVTEAVQSYLRAMESQSDFPEAYYNLGLAIADKRFLKPIKNLDKVLLNLLNKNVYARPYQLAPAIVSLVKLDRKFQNLHGLYKEGSSSSDLEQVITTLSKFPLLIKLMEICPIPDVEIELFFNRLRADVLFNIHQLLATKANLNVLTALSLQCFTNNYLYMENEKESKALEALEAFVVQQIDSGQKPNVLLLICLSSYKAFHEYPWFEHIGNQKDFSKIYSRQVTNFIEENEIKLSLPSIGDISDDLSAQVAEQYEQHPYPRWVNTRLFLTPELIRDIVKAHNLKIINNKILTCLSPSILIAGSGTGQQAIQTASRFKNCKVLALDLSFASLAYAKRSALKLGISNIEFIQGDILDLPKLGKNFDLIESLGVLHHMNQPVEGWRILVDCLNENGLMKISLYSEFARKHIAELRKEIVNQNISCIETEMKKFRRILINKDEKQHRNILNAPDFFSMSSLRDLLFHVKEHRFTFIQIQKILNDLRLEFCGFESNEIVRKFKLLNNNPHDIYDLRKWHNFEEKYPTTFAATDGFWCQKKLAN